MTGENHPARRGEARTAGRRYGVAVCSAGAGLALRFALAGLLGFLVPYITVFPAVMFAAWFGGLGPGIVATLLSAAGVFWFFVPPLHGIGIPGPADAAAVIVFVGVSIFISVLNEALRRARARSDRRVEELSLETAGRRRAEEATVRSSREAERTGDLLRITLASIGDGVIATDAKGAVTFLNPVAQDLTGWGQEDAAGKSIGEVFLIRHEKTGLPAENPVGRAIRDGVLVNLANHTVLVSKSGREIPIEDSAAPIRAADNTIVGAVLVFRDVTARRNAEDALRRSEERLKLALDAGQTGVWDWDIVRNLVDWSDRVYDIHGVERGNFSGSVEAFAQLVHPEDQERINDAIRATLQQDVPYDVEFRVIHPNGKVCWVTTTALVFRDQDGKPVRMLGATTDITVRKEAEARLRRQWHTFDTALSHTPDFTYIFDLEGRFTYVNVALLALWQKPLDEALGKNLFELEYPPALAERLHSQIRQVIETRQLLRDQTPFTGPTGESRHYEYIFVPVLTADGQVESVAGSTRDITERTRTEEALRKSEERLTMALEAGGGVGTWDWDIPADRIYTNARFARLFTVEPERAAAGVPLEEFLHGIHGGDRARIDEKIRQAMAGGNEFADEYRLIQNDGSIRWIYARGLCHLDEAGNPVRFPGVVFDITERKLAEEWLKESQKRLRAIYDGTYEYIGLLAPDGTLLESNRASLEFAGNSREEVVGRPFWEGPWFAGTPGAPEAVREGVARAAAGEFVRYEARMRRPSGECPTFDISLHPVRDERGEVILIVPEGRDISDLKRAEGELRRSNEELTRANRELEEFAFVASHDLREPLRMVNVYTQLILKCRGQEESKLSQYAGFVQQGVHRMEALFEDLLTFSCLVHTEELPVGAADLSTALNEALSAVKDRIEATDAAVAAPPFPAVRGDTRQLSHVFQNLLSNSLKYRRLEVRPEITISAAMDGDCCVISVRDNGIGFSQIYAERIFGLFKRLHKDEYPGTGLGLAICRRIVERYGGRMWAEGRPGEGATLYFALPCAAADPADAQANLTAYGQRAHSQLE